MKKNNDGSFWIAVAIVVLGMAVAFNYGVRSRAEEKEEKCMSLVDTPISSISECGSAEESLTIEEVSEVTYIAEDFTVETKPFRSESVQEGVLKGSNLTAEELETGLLYNLKDYADEFIKAEEETGVNAVFLASVAALESGWGRSSVSNTCNNLFGWTLSRDEYVRFESKGDCIQYVAEKLKTNYLTPEGIWFEGYEVADVCVHYNGKDEWHRAVTDLMGEITARIEREKTNDTLTKADKKE